MLGTVHPFGMKADGYLDQNSYWLEIMARLRPGVSLEQAQAALAPPFHQWISTTAANDQERWRTSALPSRCATAPKDLDSLRRQFSKPPLCIDDDGRPDPRHRVRERRESSARTLSNREKPRDGVALERRRRTRSRDSVNCSSLRASCSPRSAVHRRNSVRHLGHPISHCCCSRMARRTSPSTRT